MEYDAVVRFLSKEEGGRHNPPLAGYHPQLRIGDIFTSAVIMPKNDNNEVMGFGIEHNVTI
jgi:GTPases - translation elongation factors